MRIVIFLLFAAQPSESVPWLSRRGGGRDRRRASLAQCDAATGQDVQELSKRQNSPREKGLLMLPLFIDLTLGPKSAIRALHHSFSFISASV